jgi:hypothetical protein
MEMDIYEINKRFSYHAPQPGQAEKYENIREACRKTAFVVVKLCPESREREVALTKLDEVSMWANAAIARRE